MSFLIGMRMIDIYYYFLFSIQINIFFKTYRIVLLSLSGKQILKYPLRNPILKFRQVYYTPNHIISESPPFCQKYVRSSRSRSNSNIEIRKNQVRN